MDHVSVADLRNSAIERVFNKVVPIHDFTGHTDLTGRYTTHRASGAQYIMVLTCLNYIHVEPLLNRNAAHFLETYCRARGGIIPQFERMDNEQSKPLDRYRKGQNILI